MIEDDGFETVYPPVEQGGVITITREVYDKLLDAGAEAERLAVVMWLMNAQPMQQTCWALAKAIHNGEHLK